MVILSLTIVPTVFLALFRSSYIWFTLSYNRLVQTREHLQTVIQTHPEYMSYL